MTDMALVPFPGPEFRAAWGTPLNRLLRIARSVSDGAGRSAAPLGAAIQPRPDSRTDVRSRRCPHRRCE